MSANHWSPGSLTGVPPVITTITQNGGYEGSPAEIAATYYDVDASPVPQYSPHVNWGDGSGDDVDNVVVNPDL